MSGEAGCGQHHEIVAAQHVEQQQRECSNAMHLSMMQMPLENAAWLCCSMNYPAVMLHTWQVAAAQTPHTTAHISMPGMHLPMT
jgi:hypothetical protein